MKPLLFLLALLASSLAGCVAYTPEPETKNVILLDPFVSDSADKFINGYEHPIELARTASMYMHLRQDQKEAAVAMVTYPDGKFRIHSSRIATEPEVGTVFGERLSLGFFFSYPEQGPVTVFTGHTHPFEVVNIDEMSELRGEIMAVRPLATGSLPPSIRDILISCVRLADEEFLLGGGFNPIHVNHLDGVYDMYGLWLYETNDSEVGNRCREIARRLLPQRKSGMYSDVEMLVSEFGLTDEEAQWIQDYMDLKNKVGFVSDMSHYEPAIEAFIQHAATWGIDVTYQLYTDLS